MNNAESSSDYAGVSENPLNFCWRCICNNIKIFRSIPYNQISDCSTNNIGSKTGIPQSVYNLECIWVYPFN